MVMPELNVTSNQTEEKVVKVGSTVTFVDEDKNHYTFTLSSAPTHLDKGEISIYSPVGKSLLGAKLGAKVKVSAPKGEYQIEILEINI